MLLAEGSQTKDAEVRSLTQTIIISYYWKIASYTTACAAYDYNLEYTSVQAGGDVTPSSGISRGILAKCDTLVLHFRTTWQSQNLIGLEDVVGAERTVTPPLTLDRMRITFTHLCGTTVSRYITLALRDF
jgi:hypothetical protein